MKKYQSQFRDWYVQLRGGFNLLCYGLGSKKQLLTSFAREWLTDAPVVVLNGYFPGLQIKTVRSHVISVMLDDYAMQCTYTSSSSVTINAGAPWC